MPIWPFKMKQAVRYSRRWPSATSAARLVLWAKLRKLPAITNFEEKLWTIFFNKSCEQVLRTRFENRSLEEKLLANVQKKSFVQKLLTRVVNKNCEKNLWNCKQNLWIKVLNKSFEQKLWTRVVSKFSEQKLWAKFVNKLQLMTYKNSTLHWIKGLTGLQIEY